MALVPLCNGHMSPHESHPRTSWQQQDIGCCQCAVETPVLWPRPPECLGSGQEQLPALLSWSRGERSDCLLTCDWSVVVQLALWLADRFWFWSADTGAAQGQCAVCRSRLSATSWPQYAQPGTQIISYSGGIFTHRQVQSWKREFSGAEWVPFWYHLLIWGE